MQYFLKTQRCKFGSKCKFNHPKDKLIGSVGDIYEKFTKLINFMVNYFLILLFIFIFISTFLTNNVMLCSGFRVIQGMVMFLPYQRGRLSPHVL